jgi:hypothetical protein
MSSIIWNGSTFRGMSVQYNPFRGMSVESRGVFTNRGVTYAGQCKDGYACGLGVTTDSFYTQYKTYAEYGPDGKNDGRYIYRNADGQFYRLYERGKEKASARVYRYGLCVYNGERCAPDDPRVLALIAQVAPVEVRPAAPAHPRLLARHSHPSNRPMDQPARFAPPQALAKATATEVNPNAARRRWWLCDTTQPSIALQSTTTQ